MKSGKLKKSTINFFNYRYKQKIKNYYIKQTCIACPEQYDVFNKYGRQVGYLRLRHGYFIVRYPDYTGKIIYNAFTKGDDCFEDDNERNYYMEQAIITIMNEEKMNKLLKK